MSSFANLRASRQAKESRSYVRQVNDNPSTTSISPKSESSDRPIDVAHSLPPSIRVRLSTTSGRGLWTTVYRKPGDILISIKPHVAVLSIKHLSSYCSSCFGSAPTSGLKRCTKCRTVWYCNSTCQSKDWPHHKRECSALQQWAKSSPSADTSAPSDAVRCLGRLLWSKQRFGCESDWAREVDSMQSHRTSLQSSSYELHTHLSHAVVHYLGLSSPQDLTQYGVDSIGDLVDLISRFVTNTLTITSPSLMPLGASIAPLVALINHSCDPNAVVVFPRTSSSPAEAEPLMQVIALRAIEPNEEILMAYIDTTLPQDIRQEQLLETYNFKCACSLCSSPPEVDPRSSLWCPKSCGGVCSIATSESSSIRCNICQTMAKVSHEVIDALRIGQEALDKATSVQFKDPAKATQLTNKLIPILASSGLTPSSHPLLALSRLQQTLLISSLPSPLTQDSIDEVIRAATRSITGLSLVLPHGHPVRGIALAELGKMLAVDEPQPHVGKDAAEGYPPSGPPRLRLAYETLVKAWGELRIGFGTKNEGGEVGKAVREDVVALEKELGVWKQGVRNVLEGSPLVNQE